MRYLGVLLLAAAAGCDKEAAALPDGPAAGGIEASWSDSTGTARFRAPAEARWCARDTLLEITAVSHDTGVALALFSRDTVRVDGYPVFRAEIFVPQRPQASAALRFAAQTGIQGFQSTWGQVHLTDQSGGLVSGTLDLHVARGGTDSLHLTGRFSRLPVRASGPWCGRANKPAPG